jgi:hypothetical protein
MGGGIVGPGFVPCTPPPSPRSKLKGEPLPTYEILLNNHPIELPAYTAEDVAKAVVGLRSNPENARNLHKKLLLDADILIGLINETKVGLQQRCPVLFAENYRGNDRIEQAFIENEFLSPSEKEWVEQTITDYKRMVKATVSQNTPGPITPPPSIISVPPKGKCPCAIL